MTTDLKSVAVGESLAAQIRRVLGRFDDEAQPVVLLVREVARRLEEAQQKLVAQQAILHDLKSWAPSNGMEPLYAIQLRAANNSFHALAAHDAEVAAKAKAEALEEFMLQFGDEDCPPRLVDDALAKAAEYRAKAGRKE